MQVYSGSLTIAIAGTFEYVDIDPAERSGYVNELVKLEFISDYQAGANWALKAVGASIKVPARTTFDETEFFDGDIIARAIVINSGFTDSDDARGIPCIIDHDAFFQDSLRIFLAMRSGAGAASAETVFYRAFVEERKLTDSIRNTINRRAYS